MLNQPADRLYQWPVPLIGLTGGIATGKSSVSHLLKKKGFPVVCADELVKQVYQREDILLWLKQCYPDMIKDNQINFIKLRKLFFGTHQVKKEVEAKIYQHLPQMFSKAAQAFTEFEYLIYDIPLLYEKNLERYFDTCVLVYCPQDTQLHRLTKRDIITPKLADTILKQQINIENKRGKADFVIDNSGELNHLESEVDKFISHYFL